MKALSVTAGALLMCMLGACASQPPPELKSARQAYNDVSRSPGATLATTDVYEAKKALDNAEQAFADEGDEPEVRDLAYIAERKAISARAKSNIALAELSQREAMAEMDRIKQQQATAMRERLGEAKGELAKSQQQLESERQARVAAEKRTQDALTKIEGLSVKQDARGLVLSLSGSVLFATGKSELLPAARRRLDDVVSALKDDGRPMTVLGYTDSVGSEETNDKLSQRRAESVRTFLTSRGIPDDRVSARGEGEKNPIADNRTAEGRANNRRVEIVIQGTQSGAPMQPGGGAQQPPGGPQGGMQQGGMQQGGMQQGGMQQGGMQQQPGGQRITPGSGTQRPGSQAPGTGASQPGMQPPTP